MLLCFNEKAFYLKNNKIFVIIIIVNEKEMKKWKETLTRILTILSRAVS